MEIINWTNGLGITFRLSRTEAEAIYAAVKQCWKSGYGKAVTKFTECEFEIEDGE